jgi:small GTP-binding protein
MKIRIFSLAKELDIDSKLLIDLCRSVGITVRNSALAELSPEERDRVVDLIRRGGTSASPLLMASTTVRDHAPEVVGNARPIRNIREPSRLAMPVPSKVESPPDTGDRRIAAAKEAGSSSLDLSAMKLTSLPDSLAELNDLQEINLSGNGFTTFPEVVTRLRRLRKLTLSNNSLDTFPRTIRSLEELEELLLDHNRFASIPPWIACLRRLQRLDLSHNVIEVLQPASDRASKTLNGKKSVIPSRRWNLPRLAQVNLSANRIQQIPDDVKLLGGLRVVDVSDNLISSLPESIGAMTSLERVMASRNLLTKIPDTVRKLAQLKHLDLSNNQLKELPLGLRHTTALKELCIWGNDELGLPRELVEASNDDGLGGSSSTRKFPPAADILEYYFTRVESGGRPLNEVKLLIVGRGASGKTSIVRTMILNEPFQSDQQETPGIAIASWQLTIADAAVDVNVWDFAGQEITHETHRFFLTERSMYLLVLDGRRGTQQEDADYWLSHVEKYGQGSPVIVALNKWNSPAGYGLQKQRLRRRYPFIREFVETDCATGLGLEALRQRICDLIASKEMDDVRTRFPISWFGVKEQIADLRRNGRHFLTFQDYSMICRSSGIEATDPQETLARILHRLGCALYYGDNSRLHDTRVLVPDWVVNGVYALIRGVQRRGSQFPGQGMLPAKSIATALADGVMGISGAQAADYPASTHDFLLSLMVDRELCFESMGVTVDRDVYRFSELLSKDRAVYLFPELLPDDEPADFDVGTLSEKAETRFRYRYDFLPDGVISRFIVRTHPLSAELPRWRSGVVLGWEDSRALVITDRRERLLEVFLNGGTAESRRRLAGIIRSNLQTIHAQMPGGIRVREEIDASQATDQWVPVSTLQVLEREGKVFPSVITDAGGITRAMDLDPTQELNAIEPGSARKADAPRARVFISYSHHDIRYQKEFQMNLAILKNEGLIDVWYDGELRAGENWNEVIRSEIKQCDVMVLLLSTGFFASRYINGVEVSMARKLHEEKSIRIFPVKVEEVSLKAHDWLRSLHVVPIRQGKLVPIVGYRPNQRSGWVNVEDAMRNVIQDLSKSGNLKPRM